MERLDIKREDAIMTDRPIAASPWEVEAERRREVIASDVDAARHGGSAHVGAEPLAARGSSLLRSLTSGSRDAARDVQPRQAGKLNQKRV